MSKDTSCAPGTYHIILRIRGAQPRVDLFHALMRRAESSWPWHHEDLGPHSVQQCVRCLGLCVVAPRINAEDIKAASRQACGPKGHGLKVLIDRFAPGEACNTTEKPYSISQWISGAEAHRSYRTKHWLETHADVRPGAAVLAKLLPAARPAMPAPIVLTLPRARMEDRNACRCQCHDLGYNEALRFTHNGSMCCDQIFAYRPRPVRPIILEAASIWDPEGIALVPDGNGGYVEARPDGTQRHFLTGRDNDLINEVVAAAEQEAAATNPDITAVGDDDDLSPWRM